MESMRGYRRRNRWRRGEHGPVAGRPHGHGQHGHRRGVPGRERDGRWDADWDIVSPEFTSRLSTCGSSKGEPSRLPIATAPRRWRSSTKPLPNARRQGDRRSASACRSRSPKRRKRALEEVSVATQGRQIRLHQRHRSHLRLVPLAQQPASQINFFIKHVEGRPIAQDVRSAFAQVSRTCRSSCCSRLKTRPRSVSFRRSSPRGLPAASA